MDLENNRKWKDEHPFEVPEGYFDQMQSEILEKVRSDKPMVVRKLWVRSRALITGIAASIVLVVASYFVWNQSGDPSGNDPYDEAFAYILDHIDEFDLALISQLTPADTDGYIDIENAFWDELDPEMIDDELLELLFEM